MPSSYSSSPSASRTNTTYPLSSPTPTSQQSLQPLPAVVYVAAKPDDVDVGAIGRTSSTTDNNIITPESIKAGIDGLFVRFGVKDVRGIAVRGQEKAESKRDELRTMVGERYRDLLGAADSIVRMRKSSSKLLRKLERARDECDRESMAERALQEDLNRSRMVSRATTPLPSGHTPYGVATLVKLVIDCPEHVWRAIESQDYLTAARLEGLGRAVYRELGKRSRDGDEKRDEEEQEDDIEAAFPLIEQQRILFQQLKPNILQRANQSFSLWDVSTEVSMTQSHLSLYASQMSLTLSERITVCRRSSGSHRPVGASSLPDYPLHCSREEIDRSRSHLYSARIPNVIKRAIHEVSHRRYPKCV